MKVKAYHKVDIIGENREYGILYGEHIDNDIPDVVESTTTEVNSIIASIILNGGPVDIGIIAKHILQDI